MQPQSRFRAVSLGRIGFESWFWRLYFLFFKGILLQLQIIWLFEPDYLDTKTNSILAWTCLIRHRYPYCILSFFFVRIFIFVWFLFMDGIWIAMFHGTSTRTWINLCDMKKKISNLLLVQNFKIISKSLYTVPRSAAAILRPITQRSQLLLRLRLQSEVESQVSWKKWIF